MTMVTKIYWIIKIWSVWHIFLLQWSSCIDCPAPCSCIEDIYSRITNCSGLNAAAGDIDSIFTNLPTQATDLYLYHVDTSQIPEGVQLVSSSLKILWIKSGNLVSLQQGLRFISPAVKASLTVLDLSGNRLNTLVPDDFHNFTNLQTLVLSNNQVTKIYSGAFSDLTTLSKLDLSNNRLVKIYSNAFVDLQALRELDLSNNPVSHQMKNQKILNGLHNLVTLRLTNCSISFVNEKTFSQLYSLEYLHMEQNHFRTLPVAALSMIPKLTGLSVKQNEISTLPAETSNLGHVMYLELSQNNISSIHPMAFSGLEDLKELYLDENQLQTIPPELEVAFYYLEKMQVNLLGNPWICDCRLIWLGRWFRNQNVTVYSPVCRWPREGLSLEDIHLKDMNCPVNEAASLNVQCREIAWLEPNCELCPAFSRVGGREGNCTCLQGYTTNSSGHCIPCPQGFYKAATGPGSCTPCPEGSTTMSAGSASCVCEPGWTMRQGKCRECLRNTYKSHYGFHDCVQCQKYSFSPERSTGQKMCICKYGDNSVDGIHESVDGIHETVDCKAPITLHQLSEPFPQRKDTKVHDMNPDTILPRVYVPMGVASFLSATCIVIVVAVCCRRRRSRYSQLLLASRKKGVKVIHGSPDECKFTDGKYFSFEGRYAEWTHITVKRLKIGRLLGRGAFGNVHEGFAFGPGISDSNPLTVAVKRLKDSATDEERQAFKTELEQMRLLGSHTNIIGLVGSCNLNGQMAILMEYAKLGNLLTYLKEKSAKLENYVSISPDGAIAEEKSRQITEETELMLFAWQIARGMAHLESLKCVHRDLASRNILIAAGPIAKISDFGLTRDVYENGYYFRASKGRLPYKWLSPEALLWGQYSTKSDVWSFGVVLWEIATLGGSPYPGVPADHLAELHRSGYRMSQPPNCPDKLYGIINACWNDDPRQRPPFHRLADILDQLLLGVAEREYLALENGPKNTIMCLDRESTDSDQLQKNDSVVMCQENTKIPDDMVTSVDTSDTSGYASSQAGFYS